MLNITYKFYEIPVVPTGGDFPCNRSRVLSSPSEHDSVPGMCVAKKKTTDTDFALSNYKRNEKKGFFDVQFIRDDTDANKIWKSEEVQYTYKKSNCVR